MKTYEVMLLLSGNQNEPDIKKILDGVKAEIESAGGKITYEDVWGQRELAYPIQKEEQGYYVVWNFEFKPTKLVEFETNLRLNKGVLRHLVTIPQTGLESKNYAEEIELERKHREEKKLNREKKLAEIEKKEQEKFKLKNERREKKMMRKIEESIVDVKTEVKPVEVKAVEEKPVEVEVKDTAKKDDKFDEKLSKILDI